MFSASFQNHESSPKQYMYTHPINGDRRCLARCIANRYGAKGVYLIQGDVSMSVIAFGLRFDTISLNETR